MSTSPTHSGEAPRSGRQGGRQSAPRGGEVSPEDYPNTLEQLRAHLNRLGVRRGPASGGSMGVHDMQAQVAALGEALQGARGRDRAAQAERGPDHDARARLYERRIRADLADMAVYLRSGSHPPHPSPGPAGLDVASRAWLDQRFAAMRTRLEDALSHTRPPARDDICVALEEARKRLSAMERKLDDTAERQQTAQARLLGLIDQRADEVGPSRAATPDAAISRLDDRLQSLQDSFDRAMNELEAMKADTRRLATRASVTVARETARATAQHVAKAVREAAPERRFARLHESIAGCENQTRALRQETGLMQQTLDDGLEDLRGRINELTLLTRRALSPPAPEQAHANAHGDAKGWPDQAARHPASRQPGQRATAPWWETSVREAQLSSGFLGASPTTRIAFALVIALLLAAAAAMLYAQRPNHDTGAAPAASQPASPASSLTEEITGRRAITIEDSGPGSVILPGIILTHADPEPA